VLGTLTHHLEIPQGFHRRFGLRVVQAIRDDARNDPIENPIYVGYDHIQKLG
jgi:hypothetical protein